MTQLELDFDAHGCVFASRLLEGQPLPLLRTLELQNVEAQHLAALLTLPRLRHLSLSRHINGPGTELGDGLRHLGLRTAVCRMEGARGRNSWHNSCCSLQAPTLPPTCPAPLLPPQ